MADSLPDAARTIEARLMAMVRAHDLLLKADLKSIGLNSVVLGAIEQHNSNAGRIDISGDYFAIVSGAVVPVSFMLNELRTNATKYGAVSMGHGTVSLHWTKRDGTIVFQWVETGGPGVVAPQRRTLRSKLIEDALPRQLGGSGKLSFPASGVEFRFVVPARDFEARPVQM